MTPETPGVYPPAASALAAAISPAFPMYAAAGAVLIASLIVFLGRRTLARADAHGQESEAVEAQSIAIGESL